MLVLALVGLTIAIIVNEASVLMRGYQSVSPQQLTRLVNAGDALVIDLSASGDFERGHIPGAKNVGLSQFDPENPSLASARDLPVAVVCKTGAQSSSAAQRLKKAGFTKVHWLDGGLNAWTAANLPLVSAKAAAREKPATSKKKRGNP